MACRAATFAEKDRLAANFLRARLFRIELAEDIE